MLVGELDKHATVSTEEILGLQSTQAGVSDSAYSVNPKNSLAKTKKNKFRRRAKPQSAKHQLKRRNHGD